MGGQEKSFAEMRRIGNNQQSIINQQQKMIDQQHKDLENRAKAIDNERYGLETDRMHFKSEVHAVKRKIIDQSIYFAFESIPWYMAWKRWSVAAIMSRAKQWYDVIEVELKRLVDEEIEKGRKIKEENSVPVEAPPHPETVVGRVATGQALDDGSYPDKNQYPEELAAVPGNESPDETTGESKL